MSFNGTDFQLICDKGLIVNTKNKCGGYQFEKNIFDMKNPRSEIRDLISVSYERNGIFLNVFLVRSPRRLLFVRATHKFDTLNEKQTIVLTVDRDVLQIIKKKFEKIYLINSKQQLIGLFLSRVSDKLFVLFDSNTAITYCDIDDVSKLFAIASAKVLMIIMFQCLNNDFRILVDCQPIGNPSATMTWIYIVILSVIAIIALIATIIAFVVIIVKKRPKVIEQKSIYEGYDTTILSVGSKETGTKKNGSNLI